MIIEVNFLSQSACLKTILLTLEEQFIMTSSMELEKKPKQDAASDAPEKLDGYQLERSAVAAEPSTVNILCR